MSNTWRVQQEIGFCLIANHCRSFSFYITPPPKFVLCISLLVWVVENRFRTRRVHANKAQLPCPYIQGRISFKYAILLNEFTQAESFRLATPLFLPPDSVRNSRPGFRGFSWCQNRSALVTLQDPSQVISKCT